MSDNDWEGKLADAKSAIEYELGRYRSRIDDLEENNKRQHELIDGYRDEIARMRQAVQPILNCESENFDVEPDDLHSECDGWVRVDSEKHGFGSIATLCDAHNAVRKAKAEMAKDLTQFHTDYFCIRHTWDEGTIARLCKVLDPIYDLQDVDKCSREELLEVVKKCKSIMTENDEYFKDIGNQHRAIKELLEKRGEW